MSNYWSKDKYDEVAAQINAARTRFGLANTKFKTINSNEILHSADIKDLRDDLISMSKESEYYVGTENFDIGAISIGDLVREPHYTKLKEKADYLATTANVQKADRTNKTQCPYQGHTRYSENSNKYSDDGPTSGTSYSDCGSECSTYGENSQSGYTQNTVKNIGAFFNDDSQNSKYTEYCNPHQGTTCPVFTDKTVKSDCGEGAKNHQDSDHKYDSYNYSNKCNSDRSQYTTKSGDNPHQVTYSQCSDRGDYTDWTNDNDFTQYDQKPQQS